MSHLGLARSSLSTSSMSTSSCSFSNSFDLDVETAAATLFLLLVRLSSCVFECLER